MCGLNSRACTTCAHIGPSWAKKIVADSSARNVNTRVAIKALLTAEDPGPLTSFDGAVAALQDIVCHNCGKKGHYARNCAMRRAQAQYVRTGGEENLEGVTTFVDGVGLRPPQHPIDAPVSSWCRRRRAMAGGVGGFASVPVESPG